VQKQTLAQCYVIKLRQPHTQLADFRDWVPSLREPLLENVQGYNNSQGAHVFGQIMTVLYNVKPELAVQAADDMQPG